MTDQMTDSRALAGELVAVFLADEQSEGIDIGAGLFGAHTSKWLRDTAARLRTLSEQEREVVYYEVRASAEMLAERPYYPHQRSWLRVNKASYEEYKQAGWDCRELYAQIAQALSEHQGKPVALLHRDGYWTHPSGKDPFDRFGPNKNAASMPVFAHPQPAAVDAVRALQRYRMAAGADGAMGLRKDETGNYVKLSDVEAALSAAPQAERNSQ